MLYDYDFLKKLDEYRTKTIYARIIALSHDETPMETIEGRITQGSVNLDGASSVRRTCSLTMVANNYDYNNYLWGLNTKFKLEIGVENLVDLNYPSIIWFKQGTYFISSFNTARNTTSFTITIQGKDKMCALNGEIGGALTSSVDFGTIEEIDKTTNTRRLIKLPLKDIIKNVVSMYGGEPAHNIIINDLDMVGLELLEYRYDENTPLYLYRDAKSGSIFNNVILGNNKSAVDEDGKTYTTLDEIDETQLDMLVNPMSGSNNPTAFYFDGDSKPYYLARIKFGDTAGYRFTDLVYPGDLIGNVGESLTSILDKIKNILGDYEYFYNLDGQFIFQKKKIYVNSSWSPVTKDSEGKTYITDSSPVAYTFKNGELVTTFNNNPNLANLKNDFSVWGSRTSLSGAAIPVHMRYAIDQKPEKYVSITVSSSDKDLEDYNNKYGTTVTGQSSITYTIDDYDWREIIYRMAQDYYKYAHILNDFEYKLIEANPNYPTGKTGYENYYIDLISFWRELYDPTLNKENKEKLEEDLNDATLLVVEKKAAIKDAQDKVGDAKTALEEYKKDTEDPDPAELQEYANAIAAAEEALRQAETEFNVAKNELDEIENQLLRYQNYYYEENETYKWWNTTVYEAPQNLNFWFDFLDSNGELSQFSVKNVGCRPKAVNDSNVKAIYFRETPNIIFSRDITEVSQRSSAYTYVNIGAGKEDTMFAISSQGKSAKTVVDELLYQHGYCIESTTINTIPIYYLEPNVKIQVIDEATKLDGYYTVSKLSIPLAYNGTMTITATRAASLEI